MSIRLKIGLFQIVSALMLIGSATATYFAIELIDYYFERTRAAKHQMETVLRLSAQMNRYSENIAELLLLGRTELDDFDDSRRALDERLTLLAISTETELAQVRTPEERQAEAEDLARAKEMRRLFEEIDLTTQRLLFMRDQGQVPEAVALFREDIEDRLDEVLEGLIETAILEETAQVARTEQAMIQLGDRLTLVVIAVTLAAIAVSAAAGVFLSRSLRRPIASIVAGARAIGEGDLGYRIANDHDDEFADLARQFNYAAARLEAQRDRFLEGQARLETVVARRTAELEDANSALQRLDHLRQLFLADIGHELRTPITVLRGEAEVTLRAERCGDEYRMVLQRIVQLAEQMGRLVDDLLFLARAEVGAVRFDMQTLAMRDVVELGLNDASVLAERRGIAIEWEVSGEDCRIAGDAARLHQALLVVLDNAVKYSDPGEVVEVVLRCEAGEAEITTRNVGPAIAPGDVPFVFNRFYRGGQSGRGDDAGAGLGLPIAKWIVDTHGGSIELTSADRTTTVTIRLPLLQ